VCLEPDLQTALLYAGLHGHAWANHAVQEADLLVALGVRFGDRVTGKVAGFAPRARRIHVDIDPAEINKTVKVDVGLVRVFYTVGQQVKGTVNARYFFGKPVAGGLVTVHLAAFDVEFTDFATVSGATNADGLYAFETTLPSYLVGQSLD
jgi:hypothetical protein